MFTNKRILVIFLALAVFALAACGGIVPTTGDACAYRLADGSLPAGCDEQTVAGGVVIAPVSPATAGGIAVTQFDPDVVGASVISIVAQGYSIELNPGLFSSPNADDARQALRAMTGGGTLEANGQLLGVHRRTETLVELYPSTGLVHRMVVTPTFSAVTWDPNATMDPVPQPEEFLTFFNVSIPVGGGCAAGSAVLPDGKVEPLITTQVMPGSDPAWCLSDLDYVARDLNGTPLQGVIRFSKPGYVILYLRDDHQARMESALLHEYAWGWSNTHGMLWQQELHFGEFNILQVTDEHFSQARNWASANGQAFPGYVDIGLAGGMAAIAEDAAIFRCDQYDDPTAGIDWEPWPGVGDWICVDSASALRMQEGLDRDITRPGQIHVEFGETWTLAVLVQPGLAENYHDYPVAEWLAGTDSYGRPMPYPFAFWPRSGAAGPAHCHNLLCVVTLPGPTQEMVDAGTTEALWAIALPEGYVRPGQQVPPTR